MPDQREIKNPDELIYGFAAGCLENDESLLLIEQINSGNVNLVELGDLQTVISLLPTILETEYPSSALKDNVAKRLYEISKEIIEKRRPKYNYKKDANDSSEKQILKDVHSTGEILQELPVPEEIGRTPGQDTIEDKLQLDKIEISDYGLPDNFIMEDEKVSTNKEPDKIHDIPGPTHKTVILQETTRESRQLLFTLTGIVFFVLLVAVLIVYFLTNNIIESNTDKITFLNEEVSGLTKEVTRLNKLQSAFYVLTSKDTWTVNLNGTVFNPTGFGKLVIDYQTKEGLILFYNMPALSNNQSYNLWLTSNGQSFLLGVYQTKKNVEYLPINKFPDIPQNNIENFLVTIEDSGNVRTPHGLEYLAATLNNTKK
jgi:hypothetical protein